MRRLLVSLALCAAAPAAAQSYGVGSDDALTGAPVAQPTPTLGRAVPAQLSGAEKVAYRLTFLDIAEGNLDAADGRLASLPAGPLHGVAKAQLLLARGTAAPRAELTAWLAANPNTPQAVAIAQLAQRLGQSDVVVPVVPHSLRAIRLNVPMTTRSAAVVTPADAAFVARARAALAANRPADVESAAADPTISEPVRTEWLQRAAWNYYAQSGDDENASRLGNLAGAGSGEWSALGHWVAGLSAFRQHDCERAATAFDAVGGYASGELASAAAYWAHRAHLACGRPDLALARLGVASRNTTGFYGLLARRALGLKDANDWSEPDFLGADWRRLADRPGARRAVALVEVGQRALADHELRYLAATSEGGLYDSILRLADRLDLPATQYWLAGNPPAGRMPPLSARYPAPDWHPFNGWRVPRELVYAHALIESGFTTSATSHTGAKGIMQLMPAAARDMARQAEVTHNAELLNDPSFSVEYGQAYLEFLRDGKWTEGKLPKVIAAYNAGPGSVQKWNASVRCNDDPLLYIESIPFRDTRYYTEIVLRNYWMYSARAHKTNASLDAVAANQWPLFPVAVHGD